MKTVLTTWRIILCVTFVLMLASCGRKGEVMDGPATDTLLKKNLPAPHPGNPADTVRADTTRTDTTRVQ